MLGFDLIDCREGAVSSAGGTPRMSWYSATPRRRVMVHAHRNRACSIRSSTTSPNVCASFRT